MRAEFEASARPASPTPPPSRATGRKARRASPLTSSRSLNVTYFVRDIGALRPRARRRGPPAGDHHRLERRSRKPGRGAVQLRTANRGRWRPPTANCSRCSGISASCRTRARAARPVAARGRAPTDARSGNPTGAPARRRVTQLEGAAATVEAHFDQLFESSAEGFLPRWIPAGARAPHHLYATLTCPL